MLYQKSKMFMKESSEHYKEKLVPLFKMLNIKGFVTPARYSYKGEGNLLLFESFPLVDESDQEYEKIKNAMSSIKSEILRRFSFTKLLVDNDKEIWFHFNKSGGNNKISEFPKLLLTIPSNINNGDTCLNAFIESIIKKFQEYGLTQYNGSNLNSIKFDDIKNTFKSAILDVLNLGITDIYFIPIVVPYLTKRIAGIIAVNSIGKIDDDVLRNILQPAALGVMGIFHLQELDEIKTFHTTHSAASAILIESYAHNVGAHALEGLKEILLKQWDNVIKKVLPEFKTEKESFLWICNQLQGKIDENFLNMLETHSQFLEFIIYLQGKSAFWSAIARGGKLISGEIRNLWELIDGFARNNLLCGTLGISENYQGIEFFIKFQKPSEIVEANIGCSAKDKDYRYRFNEENFTGKCSDDWKESHKKRIGQRKIEYDYCKVESLKNSLEKEEIFLPEGIVGQQAVYTIWENIIRNVKHCIEGTELQPYIPFHIEISEEEEFYKINSWVDLDSKEKSNLREKINGMRQWEGILDKNNRPNMGGTSQNILCAGMLLGLNYIETERIQKEKGEVMEFNSVENSEGKERISYTFRIWKGKNLAKWEEIKNKEQKTGPPGRYKIVTVKDGNEKEEFLTNSPLIRSVILENETDDFAKLYQKWVKEFILNKEIYENGIKIEHGWWVPGLRFYSCERWGENKEINTSISYRFHHGDPNGVGIEIDFKSQGIMQRFTRERLRDNPALEAEFVEVIATKIDIYDKRLYKLYSAIKEDQQQLLKDLNVNVYGENSFKCDDRKHFLIIHLSFIESLTGKKDSEAVEEFFERFCFVGREYDFVIVTTGRGRNWMEGLSNKIRKKVRFVLIENLERCFIEGGYLEPKSPAFGIKYALAKAIFGS